MMQHGRQAWGAKTSQQEPRDAETSLGSPNKCTQAHDTEGGPRELRVKCAQPATQRMSLGGWWKPTQVTASQKDPQKHLPSKFQPAVQGRTGEQKHWQWSQRQAGDWWHCSYAERATLEQLWRQTCLTSRKLEQLPKVILNPWILQSLLIDTALPFRETRSCSINQNTGTSSANQENVTGH